MVLSSFVGDVSEVIQNLLDQSDGPRMAQGPGSSQWWDFLLWGTREQRRRLLQSLMDNVTLVGVLLSAIRGVLWLWRLWKKHESMKQGWKSNLKVLLLDGVHWCSTHSLVFFAFRRECFVFWHRGVPWVSFIGNESDNVYVSAVMVKIMSVAQREEKAWNLLGPVGPAPNTQRIPSSNIIHVWDIEKPWKPKRRNTFNPKPWWRCVSARRCSWLGRFCECHLAEGFGVHGWIVTFWYF